MRGQRLLHTFQLVIFQLFLIVPWISPAWAQTQASVVPGWVWYSGSVKDVQGKPLTGTVGITFSLYAAEEGGAPLWLETQNVQADSQGHYSVYLGATKPYGLPQELFVSGEARWLAVQPAGQAEQPRTLLLSVPYALKAGDAQTIGGLPPSAFVMAAPYSTVAGGAAAPASGASLPNALGGSGTVNFVPLWTPDGNTLGNSALFQSGSGSSAKIGLNTTSPVTALDVKGGGTIRGTLNLPSNGTATSGGGKNSQPLLLAASAFNSGTSAAVAENFRLQAEPVSNNTTSPSGKLNLLFATGTNPPTETGLSVASNGQITFATGQTFPGTGSGTITGVAAGAGLTGGGSSGSVSLSVPTAGITNPMLQNSVVTVNPGTDLTGGGAVSLGGSTTLNLDTSKVPLLVANNTFTGNQTVSGNLTATGVVTGSSYQIGSTLFAFGSVATANAFLGFAGNLGVTGTGNTGVGSPALAFNTSGTGNTAVGSSALQENTSGGDNSASGGAALANNTTGSSNTANGWGAMFNNITGGSNTAMGINALSNNVGGSFNTAIGEAAGSWNTFGFTGGSNDTFVGAFSTPGVNVNITNATAVGYLAEVDANNSMVLGSINGVNGATTSTNVGIGITKPVYLLHIGNSGGGSQNNFLRVEGPTLSGTGGFAGSFGGFGDFNIDAPGIVGGRFVVKESGLVGVGVGPFPSRIFTVGAGKGHAIADGWDVYSSRRWKTNIHTLDSALDKVARLRGVSYDLKSNGKHEIGVIAEEVGQVVPEVVTYEANGKDAQSVDYSRLTALLIEAVKQQQQQIRQQQRQIRIQEKRAQAQQLELAKLRARDSVLELRLANVENHRADGVSSQLAQYHKTDTAPVSQTHNAR